jgi:hypothetical protein
MLKVYTEFPPDVKLLAEATWLPPIQAVIWVPSGTLPPSFFTIPQKVWGRGGMAHPSQTKTVKIKRQLNKPFFIVFS